MRIKYTVVISLFLLLNFKSQAQNTGQRIKGITVNCPQDSFIQNPYLEISKLGANWTCITPYRYCNPNSFDIADHDVFNWWGLNLSGIEHSIKVARAADLKIMIKPQLFLEKAWPGIIDFENESQWLAWEKQYTKFIMQFLDLAIKYNVELFCVGTELKNSIQKRNDYWEKLIENIRKKYNGKIIYSANWDNYKEVKFWTSLDYIGISSYFPLSESKNAIPKKLNRSWKPIKRKLINFAYKKGKKIVFTEYGYLSVDGCANKHWENEDNIKYLSVNETAQANALVSLYQS
ncbi:MAG: hypothetical protein HKO66_00025, partial [Saprospiraceae bacterium]|nr:hypothetical protein [Bacteroidia bacterium]NNL90592.1 hypothetical protein [Saprospiraceae bacterium]